MMRTARPGKSVNIWWVAVVCGMASYIDSASIVSSGTAFVIYQNTIGLTPGQVGILSSTLTICIAIGALIGGRLGDRFGRKPVFTVTMVMIAAGASLLLLSWAFPPLLFGAVLVGLGTEADLPVSLATAAELAKAKDRGKAVGVTQVFWSAGIVASQAIGAVVGDLGHIGAQILFAHLVLVTVVVLVLRLTIPESESWAVAHERRRPSLSSASSAGRLRVLFKKEYLAPFIALLVFYLLTNLAANTNGQFGAYMFVNVAGASVSFFSMMTMIFTLVGIGFAFVFMRVVDGRNRMKWYAVGAVVGTAGFAIPAIFGVAVPTLLVQFVMYQFFIAFAFEAIMKLWTQESFPTLLRTTAQGVIIAVGRVSAALLALVTPLILEQGATTLFGFLSTVVAVGTITAYLVFRKRDRTRLLVDETRDAGPTVKTGDI